MTYIALNRDGLKLFNMKRCSACGDVKHVSEFYVAHRDSRCKACKQDENATYEDGMVYRLDGGHSYAVATRKCRRCGCWMAPFSDFWPDGDGICVFCVGDSHE